jgi:hypothetical protein
MPIPFTVQQFMDVFKTYNGAVFPMQVVFYAIGAVAIYLAVKPNRVSSKIISSILSFLWLWMGIIYHITFFASINKAAYLFGSMFILQGALFLIWGVFKDMFLFEFKKDKYGIAGIGLILFALIVYPVLGYLFGHIYPSAPNFGLPCPTTIFTFGLFLLNRKKCPMALLIIPLAWSLLGFMAAFKFGIWEDTGLIVASLVTVLLWMHRNKTI